MTDRPGVYQVALDQIRAERDAAQARLEEWQSTARFAHEDHPAVALIRKERDDLRAQLETVTAERDDLAAKLGSGWIEREVDARLMADLGTGPVAFERNQLRNEVTELRAQLAATTAHLEVAQARAEQCEQDAHASRTNLNTLSAMFRAAISAVVRA